MLAPELGEVKLANCQLMLPSQTGLKNSKLELNKDLTQVSKPAHDKIDQK